ncbi:MAG: PspC domain-containing protein [Chloroflexota bacterium]|nr:PspC domain-containing protein [Chloroflexota bacterium]
MQKRLYRSRTNRVVSGVCGGFGDYFNVDPVLIRVIVAALGLMSFGTILILYLAMALIVPLEPAQALSERPEQTTITEAGEESG